MLPVLKAGKPVFIDKPVAASLTEAVAIYEAARHNKTPVFSSSSLRFAPGTVAAVKGELGEIKSLECSAPCNLEPHHPDFYWYGIHGVEMLFTIKGPACQSVKRIDQNTAEGIWKDGSKGVFRCSEPKGISYGLKLLDKPEMAVVDALKAVPPRDGSKPARTQSLYFPLMVSFVEFFKTGKPPMTEEDTLAIYAFMSAADESKAQNGAEVSLESVLTKARAEAKELLKTKLK